MKSEKQCLIEDLLRDPGAEQRRETVLSAGNHLLRRRRRRVAVARSLVTGLAAVCFLLLWRAGRLPSADTDPTPARVAITGGPHELSDEELLDLFPDTPVGLVTVNGKQRLFFPRPGDAERLIVEF